MILRILIPWTNQSNVIMRAGSEYGVAIDGNVCVKVSSKPKWNDHFALLCRVLSHRLDQGILNSSLSNGNVQILKHLKTDIMLTLKKENRTTEIIVFGSNLNKFKRWTTSLRFNPNGMIAVFSRVVIVFLLLIFLIWITFFLHLHKIELSHIYRNLLKVASARYMEASNGYFLSFVSFCYKQEE